MVNKVWYVFVIIFFIGFYPKIINAQVEIDLVDCPSCIWIANNDSIFQWLPQGKTTFNPLGVFGLPYESMAIAQVKHREDTILNTYILQDFQNQDFKYWNGNNWIALSIPYIDNKVIGLGGFGPHLYLLVNYTIGDSRIYYYNGDTLKFIQSNHNTVGADIAVDSLGRGWYADGAPMADVKYFHVIDSTGKTLNKFPLNETFSTSNLYGMTIVKDTIYIGIGPDAPIHSSSILSYVIEGDSAILNKVIPQNRKSVYYSDLASCKPGIPNREQERSKIENNLINILIFPNPTSGVLKINTKISGPIKIELYDLRGKMILNQTLTSGEVDISHLASASYLYRVNVQEIVKAGLIVKK